ncbi:unnamed protein product [Moneuplotes crassus]|uniref:Uncharacterized protein n=1 Tax=Euplotes crassus TaxID=5936 RepID=A0AAD1U7L4_EUPCR|nr:unnamed protein product [Moneuplotes crassus]
MADFIEHFRQYKLEIQQRQPSFEMIQNICSREESSKDIDKPQEAENIPLEFNSMNPSPQIDQDSIEYGAKECIIPILLVLAMATYTENYEFLFGSIVAFAFIYSKFYESIPNLFRNFTLAFICGVVLYLSNGEYYQLAAMMVLVYAPFHTLLKEYSGSFNLVDIFSLLVLNCIFLIFWAENFWKYWQIGIQNKDLDEYEPFDGDQLNSLGDIPEVLLYFSPYVILNFSGVLFGISLCISSKNRKIFKAYCLCFVIVSTMILFCVMGAVSLLSSSEFNILTFLMSELSRILTSGVFWYMFFCLPLCLIGIAKYTGDDVFMTRKLFHFTALALFLPAVIANQKIMVFGSNLAIVLFIIIEFSKKYSHEKRIGMALFCPISSSSSDAVLEQSQVISC